MMDSLQDGAADVESLAVLSRLRRDFCACLTARTDELCELADAVLCADGLVRSLAGLSLAAEHQRAHGVPYDAVNHGRIDVTRLRRSLASLPLQRAADGRLVLDAVRLGLEDDVAEVTAAQVRDAITRLIGAGHWHAGDPAILVIFDAGCDVTRLSFLLNDLPVQLLAGCGPTG